MEKQENTLLYDWVSFTSQIHSEHNIVQLLGFDEKIAWRNIKGAQGYRDRMYYDKISIHYNGREDMGVWCEMSGQGCRAFESFGSGDFDGIFAEILDNPDEMNITRLDVAYDDHIGLLDLETIRTYLKRGYYVSPFQTWEIIENNSGGITITIGSKRSDILFRIYDKAQERGYTDGRHWVRFEAQLRRNHAFNFIASPDELRAKFFGIISNYLRFVEPHENDSNKSRWDTCVWWSDFLEDVQKFGVFSKPGTDYNVGQLHNFVFQQAGNSIFTYIECFGEERFFEELKKRGTALNPKQQALIDKVKNLQNEDTDSD